MRKEKLTAAGSVIAAIAASACCIGPLLALLLGVGGLSATSGFQRWRPFFLVVMIVLLAVAWYLTYRKPKAEACGAGAACTAKPAAKWSKVTVLVATLFAVGVTVLPHYVGAIARLIHPEGTKPVPSTRAYVATLKLKIEGMQCPACAANIQRRLTSTESVVRAVVIFKTKTGMIEYDRARISPDKIIGVIRQAGFKAELFLQKEK